MRGSVVTLLGVLALIGLAMGVSGGQSAGELGFNAAMPILERGMTRITTCSDGMSGELELERAITSHLSITGVADTTGLVDLSVCLRAPWQLAPAFLAMELSPRRITGLMTIYFGPVSIDLSRSWLDPARVAIVQWVVDPRWTLVLCASERFGQIAPGIGCRLFPKESGNWELGVSLSTRGVRFWAGGVR